MQNASLRSLSLAQRGWALTARSSTRVTLGSTCPQPADRDPRCRILATVWFSALARVPSRTSCRLLCTEPWEYSGRQDLGKNNLKPGREYNYLIWQNLIIDPVVPAQI